MENKELDAWIAEHVMGWKFIDRRAAGYGDGPVVYETGDPNNPTYQGFYPSADSDAAMQVLEKLASKTAVLVFQVHKSGNWHVETEQEFSNDPVFIEWAETLPLAICKAAKAYFEFHAKTSRQPE